MEGVIQTDLGHDLAIEINNSLGSACASRACNTTWNVVPSTSLVTEEGPRILPRVPVGIREELCSFLMPKFFLGGGVGMGR